MEQLLSIFDVKYSEFTSNLLEAIPEMEAQIRAAAALPPAERFSRFKSEVLPSITPTKISRTVLPGVTLTDDVWESLGDEGQKAIREFLSVLGVCCMSDSAEWGKEFINKWKESMSSIDFESIAAKMAAMFGAGVGVGGDKLPKFPERLMKGQLAKLAEEILREFKPEEFGFTPEMMEEAEKNPAKAFEIITEVYTKNPNALQNVMKRIMNRLQDKIRRGEFKPQEIAKEAEEMMAELTENSSFKDLLESLKGSFGFGDAEEEADVYRAAGREGDARRNIIKERLRNKLKAKNAAAAAGGAGAGATTATTTTTTPTPATTPTTAQKTTRPGQKK
jgi:hypothetical protein